MSRTRIFPESNYHVVYVNNRVYRFRIDQEKPILPIKYPEFYDISLTSRCLGKCPWCYTDSRPSGFDYSDIVRKVKDYFGPMSMNERPLQTALGGGECTLHSDFIEVLKTLTELGITPNYTTNGMHLTEEILEATEKYCAGVAISCHPHLEKYWTSAIEKLSKIKTSLNLHIIISDTESIEFLKKLIARYRGIVKNFVLLPYVNMGRAAIQEKSIEYDELFEYINSLDTQKDIAYGAGFYDQLKSRKMSQVSLYEPEIFSGFLDLSNMKLYKSSFNLEERV